LKTLSLVALLTLSSSLMAQTGNLKTIPVIENERYENWVGDTVLMKPALGKNPKASKAEGNKKVGDTSVSDLSSLVKSLREGICDSLKKGDEFKFTTAWDASAKVWGIGISGQSGIEVNIKCN
jgi:hypothetical protein